MVWIFLIVLVLALVGYDVITRILEHRERMAKLQREQESLKRLVGFRPEGEDRKK